MRIFWTGSRSPQFWIGPALLGLVLIGLGIAIWLNPKLLAYFFASVLIISGAIFLGVGWTLRGRVRYRAFDEDEVVVTDEDRE